MLFVVVLLVHDTGGMYVHVHYACTFENVIYIFFIIYSVYYIYVLLIAV